MDTLRVDVLSAAGELRESRDYVVSDPSAWPFSLGVAGDGHVRLRLFRARDASPQPTTQGAVLQDPLVDTTIDRLVTLTAPSQGVRRLRVLLTGGCMGVPSNVASRLTCMDDAARSTPSQAQLAEDRGEKSAVGTWAGLTERPCTSPEDPSRRCVPGGFNILGDTSLAGVDSVTSQPLPLRPVLLSPFRMDRTEYTVGRFRMLALAGKAPRKRGDRSFQAPSHVGAYCTYKGDTDQSADELPLNCVSVELATALCQVDHGRLPTESEWEHAASGRGEGRAFPWGNTQPACCTTSLSRSPDPSVPALCTPSLVEPAGSHQGKLCPGGGDVSVDGILDLGGSLSEVTQDSFVPLPSCVQGGVVKDPRCQSTLGPGHTAKSADWTAGLARARVALRHDADTLGAFTQGFRCVYPERP
jgi:formylglycine-generating enzyme required for sulfatase activity